MVAGLPTVMCGGPVRDREWSIPFWLGGLLATQYPPELLSLVLSVNDSADGTESACRWWCDRALAAGWARAEVHVQNLGQKVDNNRRGLDRDYRAYAILRDKWAALRDGEEWTYQVDSDVQVGYHVLPGLIGIARRDGWDLLAGVLENNWSPAAQHNTNVLVRAEDGQCYHSMDAYQSYDLVGKPCAVTGACCVVRGEVYDAGYRYHDPDATVHLAEDNIFCARLLAAGRRIGYVPALRVWHRHKPPADTHPQPLPAGGEGSLREVAT